jgi:hypothetical protein
MKSIGSKEYIDFIKKLKPTDNYLNEWGKVVRKALRKANIK